jgi:hypothetical protein
LRLVPNEWWVPYSAIMRLCFGAGTADAFFAVMGTNRLPFDRNDAVRRGWNLALQNLGLVASIVAINASLSILHNSTRGPGPQSIGPTLIGILLQASQLAVTIGGLSIFLRLYDRQPAKLRDIFDALPLFFHYLLALILYSLLVAAGFVLLIVPGVIWAIRYGFFPFFVVDKKLDPIAALRASRRLAEGHTPDLFWFGLLLFAIDLLGALALGIGLLITIPTTAFAAIHAYRCLLAATEHHEPATSTTTPLAPAT